MLISPRFESHLNKNISENWNKILPLLDGHQWTWNFMIIIVMQNVIELLIVHIYALGWSEKMH